MEMKVLLEQGGDAGKCFPVRTLEEYARVAVILCRRMSTLDYSAGVSALANRPHCRESRVNQPEIVYVRKCEVCGEARLARTVAMQSKRGLADWAEFNYTGIRCGCGASMVNEADIVALRGFQQELQKYAVDPRSGDRLKAVIIDQCYELARAGIPRAGLLVLNRVRAFNTAADRQDELMEQRTVEACLQAEKFAASTVRTEPHAE